MPNCYQNVRAGSQNWEMMYCVTETIQWVIYLVLTALLTFLLTLHCILYRKVNKKCSFRVFKRNRVQILSLSVVLTTILLIKETFMMAYADLVLLVFAQLLRFVIWSLTLLNFMKSATSLIPNPAIKLTITFLKTYMYIGTAFYIGFGIALVLKQELSEEDILSCKSMEFVI